MQKSNLKKSPVHFAIDSSDVRRVTPEFAKANLPEVMKKLGFGAEPGAIREMARMYGADSIGMDSLQGLISAPSVPGLIQFLQFWMPGQVWVMTADRAADR